MRMLQKCSLNIFIWAQEDISVSWSFFEGRQFGTWMKQRGDVVGRFIQRCFIQNLLQGPATCQNSYQFKLDFPAGLVHGRDYKNCFAVKCILWFFRKQIWQYGMSLLSSVHSRDIKYHTTLKRVKTDSQLFICLTHKSCFNHSNCLCKHGYSLIKKICLCNFPGYFSHLWSLYVTVLEWCFGSRFEEWRNVTLNVLCPCYVMFCRLVICAKQIV